MAVDYHFVGVSVQYVQGYTQTHNYVRVASRNQRLAQIFIIRKWPQKLATLKGQKMPLNNIFQPFK